MDHSEYDSEFCNVKLIKDDKIVIITWKKFCCYEAYRKPALFALNLLEENNNCNLIIDARNGFEDEKSDVEWAFAELLPSMSKTGCKAVVFIMDKVNNIEEEMDMWSGEFSKYFIVKKSGSYVSAVKLINSLK